MGQKLPFVNSKSSHSLRPAARSAEHDERVCYRKARKNARTSRTNNSGCSKAAKWPPFSISLQWVMFVKFGSIQRRTGVMISLGNTATRSAH